MIINSRFYRINLISVIILLDFCFGQEDQCQPHISGCTCTRGTMMCSGRNITELPRLESQEGLSVFMFSQCGILKLKDVPYPNASSLLIIESGVQEIDSGAFRNLSKLTKLEISGNALTKLSNLAFQGLRNLKDLDLSDNKLEDLPIGIFDELENLEKLVLSENKINFTNECFNSSFQKLQNLTCEACELTEIPSDVFTNFPNLQQLYFNANTFKKLQPNVFNHLTSLQELHLDGCKIEDIHSDTFNGLSSLKYLDLGNNALLNITKDTFKPFFNSLQILYLENNRLQTMQEDRAQWRNLTDLKLGKNSWTCDCSISWMTSYDDLQSIDKDDIKCASPPHLRDKNLFESESALDCGPASSSSALVLAITIPIILLSVVVILYFVRKIMRNKRRREQEMHSFQYHSVYGETVETNSRQNILA